MHPCPGTIGSDPKAMEECIKLKAYEAKFSIMKKLDELLACQRKTRKVAFKRVSVKDMIWTTKTEKEFFCK